MSFYKCNNGGGFDGIWVVRIWYIRVLNNSDAAFGTKTSKFGIHPTMLSAPFMVHFNYFDSALDPYGYTQHRLV
ncbi:unnamed protein product, partial [Absidia cylindrospora]